MALLWFEYAYINFFLFKKEVIGPLELLPLEGLR